VGALKYIDAPKPELYDLAADPGEKRNLVGSRAADVDRLRGQLRRLQPAPMVKTRHADEALKSLGYIGPGPRSGAAATADPKDRLPLLLRYEEALDYPAARRVAAFRRILAVDPGNLLVRRDLGVALVEVKQYEKAVVELRSVAAASPEDYVTRYTLGTALEALQKPREAADQYRVACEAAPGSLQCRTALQRVQAR
jgi:predicted Zn-dependent protease